MFREKRYFETSLAKIGQLGLVVKSADDRFALYRARTRFLIVNRDLLTAFRLTYYTRGKP